MKKGIILFTFSLVMISCKTETKLAIKKENFPAEIAKIIQKHGGIELWRKQKTLSFNKGEEVHSVDLHSRKTVINSPNYSLGFDGKDIWLHEAKEKSFKSRKDFYYNLYFYFYAMPFVLADDGIMYDKTDDLVFEGKNYPGIKISYKANIGSSPDDNYVIYYNKDTYQMEWLAYTVTFNSKKPSEKYRMIKYHDWISVNNLLLPKAITWYKQDDKGIPTEPRGAATEFTLPVVSETALSDSFFVKPKE
jgi:hypothetical protein